MRKIEDKFKRKIRKLDKTSGGLSVAGLGSYSNTVVFQQLYESKSQHEVQGERSTQCISSARSSMTIFVYLQPSVCIPPAALQIT